MNNSYKDTLVSLIEYFNCTVKDNNFNKVSCIELNRKAMQYGYFVEPDACNEVTDKFIDTLDIDVNSTFYKTWEDVTSKTRFELFIDQVFHYMSTYGSDYTLGQGYVPNDNEEKINFDYSKYKIIRAISTEDMYNKCKDILVSGIALKNNTCENICKYIVHYISINNKSINIDEIKNREAKVKLYDMLNMFPNNAYDIIRYIVYKTTGNTMVIKNVLTLQNIKLHNDRIDLSTLHFNQLEALASVFYRYKDILLMLKGAHDNSYIINKIRRMSKKYHKPFVTGFWESLLNGNHTPEEVYERSKDLNNFKIITLMNTINERTNTYKDDKNMYIIRNGNVFFKDVNNIDYGKLGLYVKYYYQLEKRLIDNMKSKACTIKYPETLQLACPVSEKNFIGNVPFGSYFEMTNNNIIGVYWRNEWGTHDFDLSMNNVNGERIGWNAEYNDGGVIYSGDMTNADPEATELFYCGKGCTSGTVYVNRYNGRVGSKYKLFFANESIKHMHTNYMVDPRNIKVETMCESTDKPQQMVGVVCDNIFYLMNINVGTNRVAYHNKHLTQKDIYDIFKRKSQSYTMLKGILNKAGFVEYDENNNENQKPDIDLTNLDKDTLIKLFS